MIVSPPGNFKRFTFIWSDLILIRLTGLKSMRTELTLPESGNGDSEATSMVTGENVRKSGLQKRPWPPYTPQCGSAVLIWQSARQSDSQLKRSDATWLHRRGLRLIRFRRRGFYRRASGIGRQSRDDSEGFIMRQNHAVLIGAIIGSCLRDLYFLSFLFTSLYRCTITSSCSLPSLRSCTMTSTHLQTSGSLFQLGILV